MAERLQKILAQWGVASRRQAEQLILEGRVRLNGAVGELGQKATIGEDTIEVDGIPLAPPNRPQALYLLLHKPAGVVSTCDDPQGRSTVLDLLPRSLHFNSGLHPVGRLDYDSTGALLLTNDGEVTFAFTHPRHSISKTYRVWVAGQPTETILHQWRTGILLDDRQTRPATVKVLNRLSDRTLLEIQLQEGRNRQIRRVAEQLGHPVLKLHRTAIGTIELGNLAVGDYRSLTDSEMQFVQSEKRSSLGQPIKSLKSFA